MDRLHSKVAPTNEVLRLAQGSPRTARCPGRVAETVTLNAVRRRGETRACYCSCQRPRAPNSVYYVWPQHRRRR